LKKIVKVIFILSLSELKIAAAYSFTIWKSLLSFFLMYTIQVRKNSYSPVYCRHHQHNFMLELMKHKRMTTVQLINRKQKNCDEIFSNCYRCSSLLGLMQIECNFFLIDSLDVNLQLYMFNTSPLLNTAKIGRK
jgi:hypothetical protein